MGVKTLSATLGHASVSETLDTYSHTTNEMQRSAAAKIDKAFGNAGEADFEEEENEDRKLYSFEKEHCIYFLRTLIRRFLRSAHVLVTRIIQI